MERANWIAFAALVLTILMCMVGGVSWSYSTFVPVRERDAIRTDYDRRLDRIENKLDQTNDKIDHLTRSLEAR